MLNPAHILEIALLLLVAFLIGATIGSVARLAVLRVTRRKVVAPVEVASVPAVEAVTSLVTAPVIEPMTKPAAPVAPAEIPAMDFTEALLALAGDCGHREDGRRHDTQNRRRHEEFEEALPGRACGSLSAAGVKRAHHAPYFVPSSAVSSLAL